METRPESCITVSELHPANTVHESHRGKMSLGVESGAAVADILDLIAASQLEAEGKFDEAERLLSRRVSSSTPSTTLDMLARIMIRKGEFEKARQLWLTILEREPDNQAAKSAVSRLGTPWLAIAVAKRICILGAISFGLTLAAIGIFALSGVRFYPHGPAPILAQVEPIVASSLTEPAPNAQTLPTNAPVPTLLEQGASVPSEHKRSRPAPFFSISGATVTTNMTESRVVFNEGLFSYRCEFAESAHARLEDVGRSIAEHAPDCWVIVEGHTDSDPLPPNSVYKDNYALGLHRAMVGMEVVRNASTIPGADILAASAGEADPPFVEDCEATKARNRTVVIRLIPKANNAIWENR